MDQLITLVDAREESELTDLEFVPSNQQLELISLSEWMATCL